MSIYTTYDQYPGVLERNPVYMDVQIRNRIENTAYRIWAGQTLNDMYGDPASSSVGGDETARQMLFEVKSGKIHLSSSTKARRLGRWISGSMRQQTRAVFNYTDYLAAPPATKQPLPPPETMVFFRLQQVKNGVPVVVQGATNIGDPIMGPILPVPPSTWWTMPQAMLSLSGTAPASTTAANGITPQSVMDPDQQTRPVPMHIVMPRLTDSCVIRNLDVTNSLFVALGLEHHYVEIPPGTLSQSFGAIKEIVLAGAGINAVDFVINASIVMGRPLT